MIPVNALPFNNGYGGAGGSINSQTLSGFRSWSGTATEDSLPYRSVLVSRARQLAIMSPLAAAAINRMVNGIIGDGLKYQFQGKNEFIRDGKYLSRARYIYKRLKIASHLHELDAQGRLTWNQIQEMACYNWLLSGDVFFVRKYKKGGLSSWRIIESDRCITPYYLASQSTESCSCINPDTGNRIIDGVELDDDSKPVAYWFIKDYIENPLNVTSEQIQRIDAFDSVGLPLVIHLFSAKRPDQYRGVPMISEVIETIYATQNFIQATEQAAQFEAALYGFIKSDNPAFDETDELLSADLDEKIPIDKKTESTPSDAPVMTLDPNYNVEQDAKAIVNDILKKPKMINAGSIIHLGDGEDIKFLQPQHPNGNFDSYIKSQQGQVASAIGIPRQALSCEFDTTYASAKAAVIQANETYKRFRGYFLESFIKPLFQVFVYDCLKDTFDDALYCSIAFAIESVWEAPAMMCLDEYKELQAWEKAIELGLVSRDEAANALYSHKATGNINEEKQ